MGDESLPAQLRCSVIVPVYNGAETITACLDALATQTVPSESFELLVVDDGSTDNTTAVVDAWGARHPALNLRLLQQPNAGPAAARNRGARAARSTLLLFTDADCRPVRGWVEALCSALEQGPNLSSAPAPVKSKDRLTRAPAAVMGAYSSSQRMPAGRFAQIEFEDRYMRMATNPVLDLVATYSAAFRSAPFWSVGGFDPGFPKANNEDVDLSFRLSEAGYVMHFVPAARVFHEHDSSWWGYARTKFSRAYWRTLVYMRHPSKAVKDSYTPQVLKLQIALAPLAILGALLTSVTRSLRWLLLALPFLISAQPFARFAAQQQPGMGAWAIWGIWLRSVAFAFGVGWAVLSRLSTRDRLQHPDHTPGDASGARSTFAGDV